MFNEAKPIYIKHFTPPLFFDSSDFYLLIRYLSNFRNQILSIQINLIAKKQSYLKNISSNMIFIYLLRLILIIKMYSGGEAFLHFKAIYKLVKHKLCVDRS